MVQTNSSIDIVVYIALNEEFAVVIKELSERFKPHELKDIAITVYSGIVQSDILGCKFNIMVVPAGKMGNTRSGNVMSSILARYKPLNVVVIGIAGSLTNDLQPGDVFIPDRVNEYLANSASFGEKEWTFETSGNHFLTTPRLINRFQHFCNTQKALFDNWRENALKDSLQLIDDSIQKSLKDVGLRISSECKLIVGDDKALASGPAVGKGKAFVDWLKKDVDRKIAAMEMESAGIYDAALICTPSPRAIAIRGISDFADERKEKFEFAAQERFRLLAIKNAVSLFLAAVRAGLFGRDNESAFQDVEIKQSVATGKEKILESYKDIHSIVSGELVEFNKSKIPQKACFVVPHLQNLSLRHEKEWIDQIEKLLSERHQAVICQGAALTGEGGIGKTAMAVEYAYRFSIKYPGGVFWLDMEYGFINAARELFKAVISVGLADSKSYNQVDEAEIVEALIRFFNQREFKLLVLDNLDDNDIPSELRSLSDIHLLVTTRRRLIPLPQVEMDLPSLEGSVDIFLTYAAIDKKSLSSQDKEAVETICRNVERLPLALEILGRLAKTYQLKELASELPKYLINRTVPTCNSKCTTILGTLNLAGQKFTHPRTFDVIKAAAYLAPDQVETELISAIIGLNKSETVRILSELTEFSILRKGPEHYTIHSLTQEAARILDENQSLGRKIVGQFAETIDKATSNGAFIEAYPIIPHILQVASFSTDCISEDEFPKTELIVNFTSYLVISGRYNSAEGILKTCLVRTKKNKGESHPSFAIILNNLASVYFSQGKYVEAEPLLKRALEIYETAIGNDHLSFANALNNLAEIYFSQGKYVEAEPLLKRSLEIYETTIGNDHLSFANALNNLAGLFKDQGKYAEAEPLLKRALEIRETTLGKDHPSVANSLNNLAGLYNAQGKNSKAEPLIKRALEIHETALGKDHPDVGNSLNCLVKLYQCQGKYAEAEPHCKRALEIHETALGKDHPNVATSLNNLALNYYSQGKYAEAEPLYKRGIEIYETALGKDHLNVATSLNNLALNYCSQRKYAEAEPLYKRCLEIYETALGKDHPSFTIIQNSLSQLCKTQGKFVRVKLNRKKVNKGNKKRRK
jgi:tetratricopeptide (TPR) repeat protein